MLELHIVAYLSICLYFSLPLCCLFELDITFYQMECIFFVHSLLNAQCNAFQLVKMRITVYTTRKRGYRGNILATAKLSSLKVYPIATTKKFVGKRPSNRGDKKSRLCRVTL